MYRIDCPDCGKGITTTDLALVEEFGLRHHRVTIDPNSGEVQARYGHEPLVCSFIDATANGGQP